MEMFKFFNCKWLFLYIRFMCTLMIYQPTILHLAASLVVKALPLCDICHINPANAEAIPRYRLRY